MSKKVSKSYTPVALEQASILRKFTILFILMSILPLCVLYFFYSEVRTNGTLQIGIMDLNLTLTFIVLGVLLGYFSMRAVLQQLVDLTNANRRALESVLGPEQIRKLSKEENEIAVLAQSFTAITDKLEENVRNLEIAKRTLHSIMNKVGQGISNMENIDTFLELILETVTEAMAGKVGVLLLKDNSQKDLWAKTIYGGGYDEGKLIRIPMGKDSALQHIVNLKKPQIIRRLSAEIAEFRKYPKLFYAPMVCAPVVYKDKVIGAITVSGRAAEGFEENEENLIFNLVTQTGVAIINSQLNKDMEKTYFETISALALAVDAKDKYSRGHLDRVAAYCVEIADKMGLDAEEIATLRNAARLHDLGKVGIPDEVLGKKGSLTDQEMDLMKKHPEIGEGIIKPIRSLNHLCDIIRHHHEKIDGTGYPDGLKGDEITPLVRITTVADIFDALTTNRPYRDRFSKDKAFEILRGMKGKIDPDIVDILIEIHSDQ
jgi:HD-GYP domain-containing protein (c-di-GMP phosphodiesterase class II)